MAQAFLVGHLSRFELNKRFLFLTATFPEVWKTRFTARTSIFLFKFPVEGCFSKEITFVNQEFEKSGSQKLLFSNLYSIS